MAPRPQQEDDFVLTISDDDDVVQLEDEDEDGDIAAPSPKPAQNGIKRKRGAEAVPNEDPTAKSRNKKQKKGNKSSQARNSHGEASGEEEDIAWTAKGEDDGAMNSDFEFQIGDVDTGVLEDFDGWGIDGPTKQPQKRGDKKGVDIDDLIARRRERRKQTESKQKSSKDNSGAGNDVDEDKTKGDKEEDEEDEDNDDDDDDSQEEVEGFTGNPDELSSKEKSGANTMSEDDELMAPDGFGMGAAAEEESNQEDQEQTSSEDELDAAPVPHPEDDDVSDNSGGEAPEEQARRDAFFAPEIKNNKPTKGGGSFQTMSLSRPILRGLASVGFTEPTPIQAKTIPIALLGKDVVGGAVTGSGKTGAFMIPILERLLYRPKKVPTSRVAILMPTRELAVQCFNVARKLASFTDITFCQLVGGFSLREQEIVLRSRPDVIIATPGRFIDHMRNSASFTVDTLEILVLDEADRMLEDGFADELNEILTTIPKSRQTMLFSATMTSSVDKLIRVGLNQPVRLMVDSRKQTVNTLTQEFVRLRPGREDKRLAYLLHLCSTIYTSRCIIFFRQKKEAHRVRIIFGLFGFKAAELHGSMSQEQVFYFPLFNKQRLY